MMIPVKLLLLGGLATGGTVAATDLPWDQLLGPYGLIVGAILLVGTLGMLYRSSNATYIAELKGQITAEQLRTKDADLRAERWEKIATSSSAAMETNTKAVSEVTSGVKDLSAAVRELVIESKARTESAIQRSAELIVKRLSEVDDAPSRAAPRSRPRRRGVG